jgi:hypothetical protein
MSHFIIIFLANFWCEFALRGIISEATIKLIYIRSNKLILLIFNEVQNCSI